jgi:hypothetical protein
MHALKQHTLTSKELPNLKKLLNGHKNQAETILLKVFTPITLESFLRKNRGATHFSNSLTGKQKQNHETSLEQTSITSVREISRQGEITEPMRQKG